MEIPDKPIRQKGLEYMMTPQDKMVYCKQWLYSDEILGILDGHKSFHICPRLKSDKMISNLNATWLFTGVEGRWFKPSEESGATPADLVDAFCHCLFRNEYNYLVRKDSTNTGWTVTIIGGPGISSGDFFR